MNSPTIASFVALLMLTVSRACAADAVVLPIPTLLPAPAMTSPVLPALQTDPSTIARVPYAPDVLEPAPPAQRSIVVDRDAAERLSVMNDSAVTIRLFVEGRDDSRRAQPKTFERRFADTLGGTQGSSPIGFSQRVMDTRPCPSIASAGTPFGPAYRVYGFCP
jgi:hypothetical protein